MRSPSGTRDDLAGSAQHGDGDRDGDDDGLDGDPALRGLRAVWLTMRDEDPPDRGLAELLAAARGTAAAVRRRPTPWQRLVSGLGRPPPLALATVTVMVVVGGAVMVGRGGVDAPDPRSAGAAVPEAMTARAEAPAPGGSRGLAGAAAPERPLANMGADAGRARPVGPANVAQASEHRRPAEEPSKAVPAGTPRGSAGAPGDRDGEAVAPPDEPPAEPPPTDRIEATEEADRAGWTAAPRPAPRRSTPAVPLARLHEQCEAAARRGDCAEVRRMVGRIEQADRGYRTRVANDAAIARCLAE